MTTAPKLVAQTPRNRWDRGGDVVARYGGEEFSVILPETSLSGAQVVAERMRQAIEARDPHRQPGTSALLRVSGRFRHCHAGSDPKQLLGGRPRLYDAKSAGRNRTYPGASH